MPFDIYGHNLPDGYCEVHPDTMGPYPCFRCYEEREQNERDQAYRNEHEEAERKLYEREVAGKMWLDLLAQCHFPDV